jgi:8-oxo-dGTP diphosphatase
VAYLESTFNKHGDVVVTEASLPELLEEFTERLEQSLFKWTTEKVKLVWLSLPAGKSLFIPVALDNGLVFHHCFEKQIMLVRRLVENAFAPPFATHTAGAGGIVISPQQEILSVREKRGQKFYKFPGGHLDPQEHLEKAAVREVFEETGIQTVFEAVVGFGQVHEWQFGQSNFYFVCLLRPLTFDIVIDEVEIAEAKWLPVTEFLKSKRSSPFEKALLSSVLGAKGFTVADARDFGFETSRLEIYLP